MSTPLPTPLRTVSSQKLRKLEPLSPAATHIIQAAMRDDIAVTEMAAMATTDPAFALRVISYVNNPVLGLGRRITSIQQAATLLGLRGLRSLALSLVITHLAPESEGTEPLLANCLRRAVAAREVARLMKYAEPDACFTVGLFLDAGLLVNARNDAQSAIAIALSPAPFRLLRERAAGFRMHPELGASVASEHHLGESITEAIQRHHGLTCPSAPLARIAWVAERVASVFEGGYFEPSRTAAQDALVQLGIDTAELEPLLRAIPSAVVELSTVFDRNIGPQLAFDALRAKAEDSLVALTEQYESLVSSLEAVVRTKESLENELRESSGRIEELATTDPLTGLCNRRALETALARDLARADRDAAHLSVVLLDIDHFKSINDTWGHAIGDAMLTMIGKVLLGVLRTGDSVGRLGSDEFLCVLPSTESVGAAVVAERIRIELPRHAVAGPKGPITVTASLGVASVRGPGCRTALDDLIGRADQVQCLAKQQGRDQVVISR
ncbi:MAG TPA: diguanylate cyclase [Polyangiaceae bacterium]